MTLGKAAAKTPCPYQATFFQAQTLAKSGDQHSIRISPYSCINPSKAVAASWEPDSILVKAIMQIKYDLSEAKHEVSADDVSRSMGLVPALVEFERLIVCLTALT